MLVIEGNAVYEIDCECVRKRKRKYLVKCNGIILKKENVKVDKGKRLIKKELYTGNGVTVAVMDTGLYEHPDFKNRIIGWYDAVSHKPYPFDNNGHGTQEGVNKNRPY